MQPYRQALKAEALATTRFETPPGRQLQIDFGERLVEIGGVKVKAFVFVATLGHSRRLHVRAFRAEKQEHWFALLESAFTTFGGVPEEVLMDNPRALVVRRDAVSRSVQFNDRLIAFAKHWGLPICGLRRWPSPDGIRDASDQQSTHNDRGDPSSFEDGKLPKVLRIECHAGIVGGCRARALI